MKKLLALSMILALTLAACRPPAGATPTQRQLSTEATPEVVVVEVTTTAGDTIFLPQYASNTAMEAQLSGELVVVSGCLRVNARDSNASYLLVWPPDFRLDSENDAIQMRNGAGQVVARVGDAVYSSGGEISSVRLPGRWQQKLPDDCPGPYWLVGSEVSRMNP